MATGEQTDLIDLQIGDASDTAWWSAAMCNTGTSGLTAMFFSDELADIAAAKRICVSCPVLTQCLEGALERREQHGVWGGQLFRNGRILEGKRGRGRPSATPRPQDHMPHVAIPADLVHRVRYARRSVA